MTESIRVEEGTSVAVGPTMAEDAEPAKSTDLRTLQIGMRSFSESSGGLDRYVHGMFTELSQQEAGNHHALLTGAGPAEAGIHLFARNGSSIATRWWGIHRAFAQTMREHRVDLVASHFALYAWPVLRRLRERPHVVHFHGPWADESARQGASPPMVTAKRALERAVYRSANLCITLSEAFAQVLRERYGIPGERIRVIPGGVNAQAFDCGVSRSDARAALNWPADRRIVLCVRRLVKRMGLPRLIEAFDDVRRRHPDALLLIAGRGAEQADLRKRIDTAGLADHVKLLGFVPDDDLPYAYRAAELTVVPSEQLEGFGLITLESLAAGTPVLVTPVGGLPEAVHGLSPQLVLAGVSRQAIADGLNQALSGMLDLPTTSSCQRYASEGFNWQTIARRIHSVYQEAVK